MNNKNDELGMEQFSSFLGMFEEKEEQEFLVKIVPSALLFKIIASDEEKATEEAENLFNEEFPGDMEVDYSEVVKELSKQEDGIEFEVKVVPSAIFMKMPAYSKEEADEKANELFSQEFPGDIEVDYSKVVNNDDEKTEIK